MSRNGKWMFERCDQETWGGTSLDEYDTKEEAIKAGREYFKEMREAYPNEFEDYGASVFQVGRVSDFLPDINTSSVLDHATEQASWECGDAGEDYLYHVSAEREDELSDALNKIFHEWILKYYPPNFFVLDHIEEVDIDG